MTDLWERYTYRVSWSPEDEEYVAVCVELPGLSSLEPDRETALMGIVDLAREAIEILHRKGATVPEPLATRAYSGRFVVRVPPDLHRTLVMEAQEQGVSLNRLVSAKLADRAGVTARRAATRRVSDS